MTSDKTRVKDNRNFKGQMRVVEAIMAVLIVVSAFTLLYFFAPTPSSQARNISELEKIGYNVLHDIDEQQLLARYIYNSEWSNFTSALVVSLPTDVYFNLSIYDINHNQISHPLIQYGNSQVFSTSGAIASVTYIVPGYQTNYNPRILLLKLVNG